MLKIKVYCILKVTKQYECHSNNTIQVIWSTLLELADQPLELFDYPLFTFVINNDNCYAT